MNFYYGVVENRQDPLRLGRCQVRVVGLHTHDKSQLPTADLPWATPVQPVTSAAMNGIGYSPIGPVEGTAVIIMFADTEQQQPIILGTVGGIPSAPIPPDSDDSGPINASPKIASLQLRTIPGPVTGKKLTLYDPETGATNLTSSLRANMKVFGFGLPEGTFIVSVDSGTQITISNAVFQYAENILSFDDVPTNLASVAASKIQNVLTSSDGTPVTSGDGTLVTTGGSEPDKVKPSATNSAIPTIPPAKSSPNSAKSESGIKALIAACDKVGLTTREQKCALLGIAGGESRWIPQLEAFNYSANRMKQIYSFATPEDIATYSDATKKGVTREQFFSWAYGPTKRGKGFLGNATDADGGKYFGRGFIQLTGKANYQRYQKLANETGLNIDIVNNPDSLDADINVSALVAALYIKDRVKGVAPSAHPGFFLAAKKAVGVNSPDIAALKQNYYEYFYGKAGTGGEEKDAGAPIATPPADGDATPRPSEESVQSGADNNGFRDPNSKYPLKSYIGEPDTNRLARGIIEGTVVKKKDAVRVRAVPRALDLGSWDQPEAPYGAKYPFNKVFETESGHVQEFDDTPGQERIHTYHRSGTFQEIDPTGTQVNYIVGDNFVLMEKNGCINIRGECNITVDGNTNIYARTDANIQVDQNATIKVGNNLDIGVGTDVTMAVGGDFKVKVTGDYSIDAANINTKAQDALTTQSVGAMNIKGSTINQEAEGALNVKGSSINQEAAGDANYLSGGTTNMDYSAGQFGNGAAGAEAALDVEDVPLTPPAATVGLSPIVPFTIPPEREFEEKTTAETPDDFETPEGRAASAQQARTEGVVGAPAPVATEEAPTPSGGSKTVVPVSCDIIYARKEFSNDFRMSKNFTLGMLIDGGVGGKHRLVDQMLKDTKTSSERIYTVQEIVCNLAQTAQNILEPMLEILPGGIGGYKTQWRINSGYRLKGVIANESPTSDHCKGSAIDIGIMLPDKYTSTYDIIQKAEKILPYDQLILEYRHPGSVWIHVSYKPKGSRKMAFTMVNDATYKRNSAGIPSGFVLVENIPPKTKSA
jgi:predicted chitinase